MPEIRPFCGIRYDFDRAGGDISPLIAPPYDVLDEDDKNALLDRSQHNMVAVDLPHLPPKTAGPQETYDRAAHLLESWLSQQALVRESVPAMYVYHQAFEHAGKPFTRRMFIARVRLTPFEAGEVLPHEKTFGGPKEDRLALMKATRCQLSPIFGLFTDPDDAVGKAFADLSGGRPDATGKLDGVDNRVWIARDESLLANVTNALKDKRIYIADGHHRYGTALLYRDWYVQQHGPVPDNHPVNYIMFVLASMDDPGCLILPYYRVVADCNIDDLLRAWSAGVDPCDDKDADMVLREGEGGRSQPVRFTAREKLKALEPSQVDPWYALDYAYLHRFLLEELLTSTAGAAPEIDYVKSPESAMDSARRHNGTALMVKATPMAHLRAVSEAGGLMPQKSTYFYPKLATGIVLNPLQ